MTETMVEYDGKYNWYMYYCFNIGFDTFSIENHAFSILANVAPVHVMNIFEPEGL